MQTEAAGQSAFALQHEALMGRWSRAMATQFVSSLDLSIRLTARAWAIVGQRDAYFSGLAAQFDDAMTFYEALNSKLVRRALRDHAVYRFACSFECADPATLWTLGRSVADEKDPGAAFRRLRCPRIHYWDAAGTLGATRDYIARHGLTNRRLDRLGHWPMLTAPSVFYGAVAEDVHRAQRSSMSADRTHR